jgi:hypothetical protein
MPSAASATAAAGDRFSSSRSFTDTRTPDPRIGGHELLREFYVLRVEVRIVLKNLLHGCATARHLADLADGEAAVREHRFTAEGCRPG